jgi:hypothetical protein
MTEAKNSADLMNSYLTEINFRRRTQMPNNKNKITPEEKKEINESALNKYLNIMNTERRLALGEAARTGRARPLSTEAPIWRRPLPKIPPPSRRSRRNRRKQSRKMTRRTNRR